jgi:hypothetical protein
LKASRLLGCPPHGLHVRGLCRLHARGFDAQGFETCGFASRLRGSDAFSFDLCRLRGSEARRFGHAGRFGHAHCFSHACSFGQARSVGARPSFRGESCSLYRMSSLFFGKSGRSGAPGFLFDLALCRKPSRFFSGGACGLSPHRLFRSQILRGQPLRLGAGSFLLRKQCGLGARGCLGCGLAAGLLARRFFDGHPLHLSPRRGFGLAAPGPVIGVGALVDAQAPPDSQNKQAQRGQKPQR